MLNTVQNFNKMTGSICWESDTFCLQTFEFNGYRAEAPISIQYDAFNQLYIVPCALAIFNSRRCWYMPFRINNKEVVLHPD